MSTMPDLSRIAVTNHYDRVLVAFSGGKDSLACVLHLIEIGVPRESIELHHHDVDGGGRSFMDWPITPAYCRAVAAHLGLSIFFSYKVGGFEREMLRDGSRTAPIMWQDAEGHWNKTGGTGGKLGTRRRFPQVSADLSVRWCSAYLKIDVLSAMIRNEGRFNRGSTLVVTGERAEESAARSRYAEFEPDRADNRHGKRKPRLVDHWRPVQHWEEARVWEIIERHRIVPHPAYQLGWGRLSCRDCIFASANQCATSRALYPQSFGRVAAYETEFGVTIKRNKTFVELADRGTPYPAALAHPDLARLGDAHEWDQPIVSDNWQIPAGAYGEKDGPC